MRKPYSLGDIVTMPLPEQWGPEYQYQGGGVPAYGPDGQLLDVSQTGFLVPGGGSQANPGAPGGGPGGFLSPTGLNVPGAVVEPGGMGPAWTRPPLLSDSMLPPALQRSNPLLRRTPWAPNRYDWELGQMSALWGWIRTHGGLLSCCRVPELGAPVYNQPPWIVQPSQGEKIEEMFSMPTADFTPDLLTVIGEFRVPVGWAGIINRFVTNTDASGFVDFSGSIFWRLKVGRRYARNLGNVTNTFGSYHAAFSVPGSDNIRLVSGQTVQVMALVPTGSPIDGGTISGGVFGWIYPQR